MFVQGERIQSHPISSQSVFGEQQLRLAAHRSINMTSRICGRSLA